MFVWDRIIPKADWNIFLQVESDHMAARSWLTFMYLKSQKIGRTALWCNDNHVKLEINKRFRNLKLRSTHNEASITEDLNKWQRLSKVNHN